MLLPVRFLVDESCDFMVVKALRFAGFDVASVSEISSGAIDQWVLDSAISDTVLEPGRARIRKR